MKRAVNILAATFALIGLVTSSYLLLDHYVLAESQPGAPVKACPIGGEACTAIEQHESTVLGLPYSVLGLAYFSVIFGISMIRLRTGKWVFIPALTLFLLGGLLFSLYLIYTMFVVLGEVCPYCLTAHISNITFIALYAVSLHWDWYHRTGHTPQRAF